VSVSVVQLRMFVGGEWIEASSGETMVVLNPATGDAIAEVPRGSAEDVERAVEAARKAWDEWRFKTPKDRMELLLKLADTIDENADELSKLMPHGGFKESGYGKDMSISSMEEYTRVKHVAVKLAQ
jgi:acyl-CoA reductase-like NAD-dependent aldehyde dehydrogenase